MRYKLKEDEFVKFINFFVEKRQFFESFVYILKRGDIFNIYR